MASKKVTKASKRRLMFFGTISLAIMVYFFISAFYYAMNIYQLEQEHKQLTSELLSLKQDEKSLSTQIEKLKDPEYLARYARENYLYSKNDEIVIKVQNESKQIEKIIVKKQNYTYVLFGGSLVLLLVVAYVIRKSKKK